MRVSTDCRNPVKNAAAEIAAALAQPRQLVVPDGAPFPLLSLGDVLVYGAIMAQMAAIDQPGGKGVRIEGLGYQCCFCGCTIAPSPPDVCSLSVELAYQLGGLEVQRLHCDAACLKRRLWPNVPTIS